MFAAPISKVLFLVGLIGIIAPFLCLESDIFHIDPYKESAMMKCSNFKSTTFGLNDSIYLAL